MIVKAQQDKVIQLGRLGENEARVVQFNVVDVLKEHPDAEFAIYNRRAKDGAAYPVDSSLYEEEDGYLYWTLTNSDLTMEGNGECQLIATDGDVICKSAVFRTHTDTALDGSGEVPSPWHTWVDEVKEQADKAEDAAEDAEDSAEDSEAYAVGKRGGTDVGESDPAYENNSKYYSEQAAASAAAAKTAAETDLVEWLEENITNPSSPPLDRTLASSSSAAPADMVGSLKSVTNNSIDALSDSENLFTVEGADVRSLFINVSSSNIKSADTDRLVVVPIKQNTLYFVSCGGASKKRIATTIEGPANNVSASNISEYTGAIDHCYVKNTTGKYLTMQLFVDADTDKTPSNYYSSIVIREVAAMDAEARKMVNGLTNCYVNKTAQDLTPSGYTTHIRPNENKWSSGSGVNKKSQLPLIPAGTDFIKVKASSTNYAMIAFLKNDSHTADATPDYADGTGLIVIPAGIEAEYFVPSDAKNLYIYKLYDTRTYTPEYVYYCAYKDIPEVDTTLTEAGQAADASVTGRKFNHIENVIYENDDLNLDPNKGYSVLITAEDKWSSNYNRKSWIQRIPDGAMLLTVVANSTNHAAIAFLKTNTRTSGTTPDYATGSGRTIIPSGTTEVFEIPDDANYVYILNYYADTVNAPERAYYHEPKAFVSLPLGLHEKPATESVLNIIKRCRQMTDIKWTPAVDLSRYMVVSRGGAPIPGTANAQNYLGTFKAGVEYTGVPYGRVAGTVDNYGINYGTVGHYIGFDTFISSVSNPKSRLSSVDVGSVSNHRSVIYASVCSGMTCYALNVNEVPTANIGNISGLELIGKLNNSGTLLADNLIKLGDVLNKYDYHTGIITDIIRDEEGVIQSVEISEATTKGEANRNYSDGKAGGLCVRRGWTREQLFDEYTWGSYSVYRYTKNVPYTPSPYVNVGDEFDSYRIEHFPIMPYEGEGFAFKTGYIPNSAVKLVITLDGYSYVKVFKDGTEVTGSPFSVSKDANNEINPISVTEIGEGEYTAYLCNISGGDVTNLTYACHWSIS